MWGTMEDQRHTENVPRTQRQSLTRHLHWIGANEIHYNEIADDTFCLTYIHNVSVKL